MPGRGIGMPHGSKWGKNRCKRPKIMKNMTKI